MIGKPGLPSRTVTGPGAGDMLASLLGTLSNPDETRALISDLRDAETAANDAQATADARIAAAVDAETQAEAAEARAAERLTRAEMAERALVQVKSDVLAARAALQTERDVFETVKASTETNFAGREAKLRLLKQALSDF